MGECTYDCGCIYGGVQRDVVLYVVGVQRGMGVYTGDVQMDVGVYRQGVYIEGYWLDTLLCTTSVSAFYPLEVSDEPCHLSLQGLSYP